MLNLKSTPFQEYPKLAEELMEITPSSSHLHKGERMKLFIKREDFNPSGSHKDRAIWGMIDYYIKQGQKSFVISSSGNAAISAAYYAAVDLTRTKADKSGQIKLYIFISPNIAEDKRIRLERVAKKQEKRVINISAVAGILKMLFPHKYNNVFIHESPRAKSDAIEFARSNNFQLMRTSTDDLALEGYKELASELIEQAALQCHPGAERSGAIGSIENNKDSIALTKSSGLQSDIMREFDLFIPTSSGTTIQGLFNGFQNELLKNSAAAKKLSFLCPQIKLHIIQTTKVNTIAREFDQNFEPSNFSLASAIVDTIGHRKERVIKSVKESGGSGWVISDEELEKARKLLEENTNIQDASWDSLLSLAGLIKVLKTGKEINSAILLFTGR